MERLPLRNRGQGSGTVRRKIVAVDFDGTVVDHRYPDVGPEAPGAVMHLRDLVAGGWDIVLFTMRSGEELDAAVRWFAERDIPLFGVNRNPEQDSWTTSPKAYAQVYIDDAALGCPLVEIAGFKRKCVDWYVVHAIMAERQ